MIQFVLKLIYLKEDCNYLFYFWTCNIHIHLFYCLKILLSSVRNIRMYFLSSKWSFLLLLLTVYFSEFTNIKKHVPVNIPSSYLMYISLASIENLTYAGN